MCQRMASNEELIQIVLDKLDGSSITEKTKYVKLFKKESNNQGLWEVGIAHMRVVENFKLGLNLVGHKTCRPFTKMTSSNWNGPSNTSATRCTIISFESLGAIIKGMLMADLLES